MDDFQASYNLTCDGVGDVQRTERDSSLNILDEKRHGRQRILRENNERLKLRYFEAIP